jgi:DNA helicase-2/ATP-dependent DNA helicase PcrA
VLKDAPLEDIERAGGPPLKEAVRRIRASEMNIAAGYDGEFGVVKVFEKKERDRLLGQTDFIAMPGFAAKKMPEKKKKPLKEKSQKAEPLPLFNAPTTVSEPGDAKQNDPLFELNADQRRVAETQSGPLLVVAGPGTGKTRTLVARIAHQLKTGLVRPNEVLAVTFTNQACEELSQRLKADFGSTGDDGPLVTTFHGLGQRILEESDCRDGVYPRPLDIISDDDRFAIGQSILGEDAKKRDVEDLLAKISLAKQTADPAARFLDDAAAMKRFEQYESALQSRDVVDIDDLVLRALKRLVANHGSAETLRQRFRSVSIDEYQDINDVQADLVKQLCPEGANLLVIGDPDQAIYGFRGAEPGHFKRFEEAYPGATTVSLNTSYRLTTSILEVAQSVLDTSAPLVAVKEGPKVEVTSCPTAESEAEQILVRIERIVGGTSHFAVNSGRGGDAEHLDVGFGDIAVLTRMKAQQKTVEKALARSGVPCRLVAEDEPHDPRSDKVAVMTMHASKGREFEVVFVAGVENDLVPLNLEGLTSDPEEERRLLYVAITRAKQLAVLSYAKKRMLFGKQLEGGPSSFIVNLPERVVTRAEPKLPDKKRSTQLSLF